MLCGMSLIINGYGAVSREQGAGKKGKINFF